MPLPRRVGAMRVYESHEQGDYYGQRRPEPGSGVMAKVATRGG